MVRLFEFWCILRVLRKCPGRFCILELRDWTFNSRHDVVSNMKRANLGDVDYADLGLDGLPKRHCNDRTPEDQMNCPQVLISTRFANSKPNSQLPVPKRAADIWQIIIQTETGQQFTVDIPPFHTIKNLKEIIATKVLMRFLFLFPFLVFFVFVLFLCFFSSNFLSPLSLFRLFFLFRLLTNST